MAISFDLNLSSCSPRLVSNLPVTLSNYPVIEEDAVLSVVIVADVESLDLLRLSLLSCTSARLVYSSTRSKHES